MDLVGQFLTYNIFLKNIRKVFGKFDLKITIESNLTKTGFLDVALDLFNYSYAPFRKPSHVHQYQIKPPTICCLSVPEINKRLTTISKDECSFKRMKEHYQEELIKCHHKHELVFNAEKSNGIIK